MRSPINRRTTAEPPKNRDTRCFLQKKDMREHLSNVCYNEGTFKQKVEHNE